MIEITAISAQKVLNDSRECWPQREKESVARSERFVMKTLLHSRQLADSHSHSHPFHLLFSLVASFVLAILAVLMLVVTAK